jgi:hypothetical protein
VASKKPLRPAEINVLDYLETHGPCDARTVRDHCSLPQRGASGHNAALDMLNGLYVKRLVERITFPREPGNRVLWSRTHAVY